MINVRPATTADYTAIHALNALAFGRENEATLVERLRTSAAFVPGLSLVADDAGRVIGHLLLTAIHIRTPERRVPALALAPMAVHPDHQHRGVGAQLVRQGLTRCRQLGHGIVIVVGHPDYYPRFGFTPARAWGLEAPFPVPDDAFMVLELIQGALAGIAGMVEYPPPFAAV